MVLVALLCSVLKKCQETQLPRTMQQHNHSGMDFFMALFMMCAIEAVVIKIMLIEDTPLERRRRTASYFHDRD